ncbi:tetratricopeptide repeat protein [Agrobacterium vitis]|uniref:Tetratricopeptide repeat protein n=1 Tax=Agrobacterium vitis TaxID=373 RepID=A0A368NI17_AGRVI|nr:sulfotransferase [Agrobacterium vitis]KAA3511773.1 tetratricopeptide repeat protein [Agrobacterium vitis]KAA3525410.1 tetratricopeptide repeat protein [Agrobacterium vitis]MCF1479330.1 tetratricopeptide repeat protein [Agrobacterium vitis]MUZ97581.1 tetratricopeptide repeat protein [Agrobacterium vitis]MVA30440.1 tetratricopeptide repeat protein [Agrobacterium vitis]
MSALEKLQAQRQKLEPLLAMARQYRPADLAKLPSDDRRKAEDLQHMACKAARNLAEISIHLHDHAGATELLQAVLLIHADPSAHSRLADLAQIDGRWPDAISHYQAAIAAGGPTAALYSALAYCFKQAGRHLEANEAYNLTLHQDPNHLVALNDKSFRSLIAGDFKQGLALAERAVSVHPGDLTAHFYLGQALQGVGRMDEAKAAYRKVLDLDPTHVDSYLLLGMLSRSRPDDPDIAAMQALHATLADEPARRLKLGFALYKALNDISRYDDAFTYLEDANRERRRQFTAYTIDQDLDLMQALQARFTADFVRSTQDSIAKAGYLQPERPIFVVGLPRSGTSLTEQILASHADVYGAGELETLSYAITDAFFEPDRQTLRGPDSVTPKALADAARRYIVPVREKAGNARVVDKMPVNFLWVGFIKLMFSDARIVIMKRDPLASGFALYSSYFPSDGMQYSYDQAETARYIAAQRRLCAHWQALFPDDVLELGYEQLTLDQEAETRRLLAFCGLPWDANCLDFHKAERAVMTLSSAQVRQGLYSGVDKKTAHYRHRLGPMITGLEGAGLINEERLAANA